MALALLVCGPAPQARQATPQERARAEAAQKRAADRIKALQKESDELAARERTILQELRKLEVDRQLKVEEVARLDREMKETARQIAEAGERARALEREADLQRPDVEARLVQLYRMGGAGYWRLLLDVDDLRSVGRAYRTASAMMAIDRARIQEHQQTLEGVARERAALQARSEALTKLQRQAVLARAALDRAVAARAALVDSIDVRRDLNAQLAGELQGAQQQLQASIAQLERGGRPAAIALPLRPFQGALAWPAKGTVRRRFGRRGGTGAASAVVSNGVELEVAEGQPVRAVHEGTVAYADQFTGYGNLVIVEHGNRSYSLYGYLQALAVSRGDRVEAGTNVGTSGRNPGGNPGLYFELRVDGAAVDPLQWLKR
jgi:septal ring factor EnvC (AmiA/AmiB activator)